MNLADLRSGEAQTILVLGGGNALGSYLAGAYETLSGAGVEPD
jgi:predicted acylesterase/phospholipase RssA